MSPRHLFVVGSPRSGTTWLQLLLAQHPEIATNKETQLFTQYVKRLQERWAEELREAATATTNGLTRVLSEDEFMEAIQAFCDRVFLKLSEQKPGAGFVLEKSPEHGLHADTILRLYPDAWFLHIIRDPRAVSSSFRHASRSWWSWAPSGPIETTRRWRRNVLAAREIPTRTSRYLEVHYEDLREQGEPTLAGIFEWLGVECDSGFCRDAVAACEIDRLKSGEMKKDQPWNLQREPEGFFRSGRKDGWRQELPARDIRIIEYEAGSLLVELGYEAMGPRSTRLGRPFRIRLHGWLEAAYRGGRDLADRLDWRLKRLLRRM